MRRAIPVLVLLLAAASAQLYDHVTITADTMVPLFAPMTERLANQFHLTDTVVAVEDIYATWPGRDRPEKIRNFIIDAYVNWLTTYVLIGGDVEVVPCRYTWGNRGYEEDIIPCDLYYAALDGDWDADHDNEFGEPEDSVDLYPDVQVGRFTASSPGFIDVLVQKFLQYTGNPEAPYLDRIFLNGFDLYEWCLAEETMEFYDSTFVPEVMKPCAKVYDSHHSSSHRSATLNRLNTGQHIWVHSDHSGWSAMGVGWENHREVLAREDLSGLTNEDNLTIMMTNGCSAGAYDSADCIVEHFVMAPQGGGVAAFSNTRTGLLDASKPLHGQSFMQMEELLRAWFSHPQEASLADLATVQALVAPLADTSNRYRWTHYQFTLFGEPSMPVWLPPGSGVEENLKPQASSRRLEPTVIRGVLLLPTSPVTIHSSLFDITGRQVMALNPGPNDVSRLASGVYYWHLTASGFARSGRIVLTR